MVSKRNVTLLGCGAGVLGVVGEMCAGVGAVYKALGLFLCGGFGCGLPLIPMFCFMSCVFTLGGVLCVLLFVLCLLLTIVMILATLLCPCWTILCCCVGIISFCCVPIKLCHGPLTCCCVIAEAGLRVSGCFFFLIMLCGPILAIFSLVFAPSMPFLLVPAVFLFCFGFIGSCFYCLVLGTLCGVCGHANSAIFHLTNLTASCCPVGCIFGPVVSVITCLLSLVFPVCGCFFLILAPILICCSCPIGFLLALVVFAWFILGVVSFPVNMIGLLIVDIVIICCVFGGCIVAIFGILLVMYGFVFVGGKKIIVVKHQVEMVPKKEEKEKEEEQKEEEAEEEKEVVEEEKQEEKEKKEEEKSEDQEVVEEEKVEDMSEDAKKDEEIKEEEQDEDPVIEEVSDQSVE